MPSVPPLPDDRPSSLVVGAAVVRHGRVLATRRTRPASAAGRWELPGGKVEPGEEPHDAVVREVSEELGCVVRVTGPLDAPDVEIRPGLVLRAVLAELVDGEPVPREHDALRWLGPEDLDAVDWLPADVPLVERLRDLLLDGPPMAGGNVGGATRVGSTVRRPVGDWTPAVHGLLGHLRERGLRAVPEVLGHDARGREVLTHLPGHVIDVDTEALSDAQLADVCRWARALHDLTRGADLPGPWRFPALSDAELVTHGDLAPYNVCFEGDVLTGVFDWDVSCPSTPVLELAHLAWSAVPLFREVDPLDAARRLDLMGAAYGGLTGRDILAAVPVRVQGACDTIRAAIAAGDAQLRNLAALGEPERTEARLTLARARFPAIEELLT